MTIRYLVHVNGIGAALSRQFGCQCNRCTHIRPVAHTSASIIGVDDTGQTQNHVLIDVGLGVSDSLLNSPYFANNQAKVDWILLTHWHPDHTVSLNWLSSTLWQSTRRKGQKPKPIPVWCRTGTAGWMARRHDFEWHRYLAPHLSNEAHPPGTTLPPIPLELDGLTITPITVSHHNADVDADDPRKSTPCCAAFMAQTAEKKALFLWDLDIRNTWLERPESNVQKETIQQLQEADYLFIDCATWATERIHGHKLNHLSFSRVQRIAKNLRPKETLLVHLSGHPDGIGNPGFGWSDEQWTTAAQQVWQQADLPGSVRVPAIGDTFSL